MLCTIQHRYSPHASRGAGADTAALQTQHPSFGPKQENVPTSWEPNNMGAGRDDLQRSLPTLTIPCILLSPVAAPALPCMKEALLPISCFSTRKDLPKAFPCISPRPTSPSPALLPARRGHQLQTRPGVIVSCSPPPPLPHPSLLPHRCLSPAPSPPAVCFQVSPAQLRVCLFILRAGRRRRREGGGGEEPGGRRSALAAAVSTGPLPARGDARPQPRAPTPPGGCAARPKPVPRLSPQPPAPSRPGSPSASFPQEPHTPPATQTRTGKAGPEAHPDLWPPLPRPPGLRLT